MVAEVWELEGEQAPLDPSGMLGYFMTVLFLIVLALMVFKPTFG